MSCVILQDRAGFEFGDLPRKIQWKTMEKTMEKTMKKTEEKTVEVFYWKIRFENKKSFFNYFSCVQFSKK